MLESGDFNVSFFIAGLVGAFEYKVSVDAAIGCVPDGGSQCGDCEQCLWSTSLEQQRERVLTLDEVSSGLCIMQLSRPNPQDACPADTLSITAEVLDMFPGLERDSAVVGSRHFSLPHPRVGPG